MEEIQEMWTNGSEISDTDVFNYAIECYNQAFREAVTWVSEPQVIPTLGNVQWNITDEEIKNFICTVEMDNNYCKTN